MEKVIEGASLGSSAGLVMGTAFILASATYAYALQRTVAAVFWTGAWARGLLLLLLCSIFVAATTAPAVAPFLDVRMDVRMYIMLCGSHVFASSAPVLLWYMLRPHFTSPISQSLALFSFAMIEIGGISEIIAHFEDGWWFHPGCEAADGTPNVIFSVCLVGAFSFLAAACFPTRFAIAAAFLPPLATAALRVLMTWTAAKKLVYASQGLASGITCVVLMFKFTSWWPLLYFAQAFNIVRNGKRILTSGEQLLHVLPSVYGWFSYVVPLGLTARGGHPATPRQLAYVAAACIASVYFSQQLEDRMVDHTWLAGGIPEL